ncbi:hypothetical protein BV22DRAFT_1192064 [Leucogyrophana mollusca]|uniref:Uncharacterized protein n=1 Tax=Leucogyrophana mollusca TaxID=85980 RepID=A0ACB8BV93_9AGAM|nr:hypothetical protein BV22DRAFT_1192064 [Leucogyrophana mollusca]
MVKHGPKEKQLSQRQFRAWFKADRKATAQAKALALEPSESQIPEPTSKRLLPPAKKLGGRRNPILVPPTPSQTRRIREAAASKKADPALSPKSPRGIRSPASPRRNRISLFEELGNTTARDGAQIVREIAERRAQLFGQLTTPPQSYANLHEHYQSLASVMGLLTATASADTTPTISPSSSALPTLQELPIELIDPFSSTQDHLEISSVSQFDLDGDTTIAARLPPTKVIQEDHLQISSVSEFDLDDTTMVARLPPSSTQAAMVSKTPDRSERYSLATPPATEQRGSPITFNALVPKQHGFTADLIDNSDQGSALPSRPSTPTPLGCLGDALGSPISVIRPARPRGANDLTLTDSSAMSKAEAMTQDGSRVRELRLATPRASVAEAAMQSSRFCPEVGWTDPEFLEPSSGSPLATSLPEKAEPALKATIDETRGLEDSPFRPNKSSGRVEGNETSDTTAFQSQDHVKPVEPLGSSTQTTLTSDVSAHRAFMSWTQRSRALTSPPFASNRCLGQLDILGSQVPAFVRHSRGQTAPLRMPHRLKVPRAPPAFTVKSSSDMRPVQADPAHKVTPKQDSGGIDDTSPQSRVFSRIPPMIRRDAVFHSVPISTTISRTPEKLRARRQSQSRVSPPPLTVPVSIPRPPQRPLAHTPFSTPIPPNCTAPFANPLSSSCSPGHTGVSGRAGTPMSQHVLYGVEIPSPRTSSAGSRAESTSAYCSSRQHRGTRLAIWRLLWTTSDRSAQLDIEAGGNLAHRDDDLRLRVNETVFAKFKKLFFVA